MPCRKERLKFKVVFTSWSETQRLAKTLASKIKRAYEPDIIIGIARGGLIPACIISDRLLQPALATFKIELYWLAAAKPGRVRIVFPLAADIKGKKVLLVDDFTDTGKTLALAVRYLRGLKPAVIKTAVLQHKVTSKFIPDFWAHKIVRWRWIIGPWALHEGLVDLARRVWKPGMAIAGVRAALLRRFGIRPKIADLRAALADVKRLR
jgi:hypothetical protein